MDEKRFVRIYKQGAMSVQEVWVDRVTGVQYLMMVNGYAGGLTPLLDRDGKPLLADVRDQ